MAVAVKLITAEEFAASHETDARSELIRGEIVEMCPPAYEHSIIAANVIELIGSYVRMHKLGRVLDDSGYTIARDPDTVLAPDAVFIQAGRLPDRRIVFPDLAPDLVFEVVSPSDLAKAVNRKVHLYLTAGVRLVCVIWPETRVIELSSPDGKARTLREQDMLDFGDVIPGFQIKVAELFD
jgi:Uma2 family endonuclease